MTTGEKQSEELERIDWSSKVDIRSQSVLAIFFPKMYTKCNC